MSGVVATPLAGPGRRLRRSTVTWIVLSLLVAGLSAFLMWPTGNRISLDPENANPRGARAVAQVVSEHGVRVSVVHTATQLALASAALDGPTTLVVTGSEYASPATGRAVAEHAARYRHVVLVGLYHDVLVETGLPVETAHAHATEDTLAPGCDAAVLGQTRRITSSGQWYRPSASAGATTCFTAGKGSKLVSVPASDGLPAVDGLATGDVLANREILKESHAVLALRLLSRDPSLVWYNPDANDVVEPSTGPETSQPGLIPPWGVAALSMLGATTLGAMLWRGRRLGRLVVEPLPVVVKAIETTRSRARLYFAARDTNHGAAILQRATRTRLGARLALAPDADDAALVAAVARATGRDPQQVGALLFDPRTPDDAAFVSLANALATLEQEARP